MNERVKHLGGLTSTFGKDLAREKRLAALNELLAPVEAELERHYSAPRFPVTFVLGPPRSGTTLTSQLLAQSGLFGIISNFAARFWRAPALGLRIERDVSGASGDDLATSFESHRGATIGWSEPSEFGYFWSRFFDLGQRTHRLTKAGREAFDTTGLRRAVAAMEAVCERPMAFKNNTWFTFHADLLGRVFPNCTVVICRRKPFFLAQSLWRQRQELYGDVSRWWSMRPPNYQTIARLDPIEQVAAQAVTILAEMDAALARVKNSSQVELDYQRLVADPRQAVTEIAKAAGVARRAINKAVARLPERFESRDRVSVDKILEAQLRRAIEQHADRYGFAKS